MPEKPRVYVSHAPQDGPYALHFVQDLIARGAAVWTNDAAPDADTEGTPSLANIQTCDWFIVIQTPDAASSSVVGAEIAAVLAAHQQQPRRGLLAFVAAPSIMSLPPDFARVDVVRLGYVGAVQVVWSAVGVAKAANVAVGSDPSAARQTPVALLTPWPQPGAVYPTTFGAGHPVPYDTPGGALTRQATGTGDAGGGRGLSRRAVLLGLGAVGTAALVAGGVVALHALELGRTTAAPPTSTTTIPGYLTEGKLLTTYTGHIDKVFMVAWSPDGVRAASASQDQTAQVWQAGTGRRLVTYRGHATTVAAVAWAHHSERIASASYDTTAQIWDAATGRHILTYTGHTGGLNAARWSPDDARLASAGIDGVQVWAAATGERIWAYSGHRGLSDVAWSPDGRMVAIASFEPIDRTVTILNAANGTVIRTYRAHPDNIFAIAWSPDGRMIASAGASGVVRVWTPTTGTTITTFAGNAGSVNALAWSRDSRALASGGGDSGGIGDTRVLVWAVATGQILSTYNGHPRYVNSADWSPDDTRIVSGSDDHTAQVWQVRQG